MAGSVRSEQARCEVIRRLRSEAEPSLVVRMQDGRQLGVPGWMLDPSRCEPVRDEYTPVIAIEALQELAARQNPSYMGGGSQDTRPKAQTVKHKTGPSKRKKSVRRECLTTA